MHDHVKKPPDRPERSTQFAAAKMSENAEVSQRVDTQMEEGAEMNPNTLPEKESGSTKPTPKPQPSVPRLREGETMESGPAATAPVRAHDPILSASMRQLTGIGHNREQLKTLIAQEYDVQMNRLNLQVVDAFELYPKYPGISELHLTNLPLALADKEISHARIVKLIAYAEGAMMKASMSDPTGKFLALPADVCDVIDNAKRHLHLLGEAIGQQRAREEIERAGEALAAYRFPTLLEDLRSQHEVEQTPQLARQLVEEYVKAYEEWKTMALTHSRLLQAADWESTPDLRVKIKAIWKLFAVNKPPDKFAETNPIAGSYFRPTEGGSVLLQVAGLENELDSSITTAANLLLQTPRTTAELAPWENHVSRMKTLGTEAQKKRWSLMGLNELSDDRMVEFKAKIEEHDTTLDRLSTRQRDESNKFQEEREDVKRGKDAIAKTTPKTQLKNFHGTPEEWLPWRWNQDQLNTETDEKRKFIILERTIKCKETLASLEGVTRYTPAIEILEKTFGTIEAQAPFILNELKSLPNEPSGEQEILNIDGILGKRRKLQGLKGWMDLFNDLFISTLEHKLSARRRVEWSDMLVDGRVNSDDKVAKFVLFITKIRDSHFARKKADPMKVAASKPKTNANNTGAKGLKSNGKIPKDGDKATCWSCGSEDHMRSNCPTNTNTSTRKCALCNDDHAVYWCNKLKEATDIDKLGDLHQLMQSKRLCTRCLRRKRGTDQEHVSECSHTWEDRDGRKRNYDCTRGCAPHSPNEGIHKALCPCTLEPDSE